MKYRAVPPATLQLPSLGTHVEMRMKLVRTRHGVGRLHRRLESADSRQRVRGPATKRRGEAKFEQRGLPSIHHGIAARFIHVHGMDAEVPEQAPWLGSFRCVGVAHRDGGGGDKG